MTDEPAPPNPDTLIPPTAPTPPTPPVAPARYATTESTPGRRRRTRTVAGVIAAVVFILVKIGLAVGAGHLIRGASAPIAIIIVVALLAFGFLSRFMRL